MIKKDKKTVQKTTLQSKLIKYTVIFVIVALPLFLLCYFTLIMSSDIRTNRGLKANRIETVATVTAKEWIYGLKTHRAWAPDRHTIDYYFTFKDSQGNDTRQISQKVEVSETLYNSVDKGSTLQVAYLPDDPTVNKPSDEIGKASLTTKLILFWVFGLSIFYILNRVTRPFEKKHVPRILFKFMFGIGLIAAAFSISIFLTYVIVAFVFKI